MRVRFGEFIVDDATRQLARGVEARHLSPKAFDLLVTLIRERPKAFSKEELHARLWPKTFVSDASLAMLVAEVRAALGESAREPRWLRTVHRHGYAFQGEAVELSVARATAARDEATIGYWLVTESRQIPLYAGDNIVGRDPKARVWLDSPSVSRQHACIRIHGDVATLEDLGSKNGTFAGDERVARARDLGDGDELRFGSVSATFRAWAAEPTRTEGDAV